MVISAPFFTSEVLRQTFRDSDIIARLGGDGFVVMAISQKENFETFVRQKITSLLVDLNSRFNKPFAFSFSLGVAQGSVLGCLTWQ